MATLSISSTSSPYINEWLSLPSDLVMNDSFADDLIRQFDKKRSSLHRDLEQEQTQQQQSRKSSSASSDQPTPAPNAAPAAQPKSPSPPRSISKPRRSSAGELLRRSSVFFRTTLDSTWKNISRSHENLRNDQQQHHHDDPIQVPFLPETIAIHTTITFPPRPITKKSSSSSSSSSAFPPLFLSPPVITHYPPKPLQYSPISMPVESSSPHKTLMHRLSMPALRHHASSNHHHHHHQHPSNSANVPFFIKRKKSSQL